MKETGNKRDIELVKRAQAGDDKAEEELLQRHKSLVRTKANLYYIIGADEEDVLQEGMIGLFNAIRKYDDSQAASFSTFAGHCIANQIISAIRSANTRKHQILNESVSLDESISTAKGNRSGVVELRVEDTLATPSETPEQMLVIKDIAECIIHNNDSIFSKYEMDVLSGLLQGKDRHQIASDLGKTDRSVENCLQRVRRKAIDSKES